MSTSNPPTPTTSEPKSFCDHFWGPDRNITEGVNVLYDTVKISHSHSKLLHEVLKEHAEIEQKYNNNFQKLLTKLPSQSTEEKSTFAPVWNIMNKFYNTFYDFHTDHVRNLNSIVKSLSNYLTEEKKCFNSLVKSNEQSQHLKQAYSKSFNNYSESKSQFYIASQELFKNTSESEQDSNPTKDEFEKSKEEYKSNLNKHTDSVQHLTMKIEEIFLEYEMFEKERLKQLIDYSVKFIKYILSHFFGGVNVVNVPIDSLKTIIIENSLLEFAKKFGTKGLRPISPIYKDPPSIYKDSQNLPWLNSPTASRPLPLVRSTSTISYSTPTHSKQDTPRSKPKFSKDTSEKSHKSSKPKKSINILHRKKGKQSNSSEHPNSSNPHYDETGISPNRFNLSAPTEDTELPDGFVLDADGNRIRLENGSNEPTRKFSYSSTEESDSDRENKIRQIKIKPKENNFEKSVDADTIRGIIGNIKLGPTTSNLANKKCASADGLEIGSHRTSVSLEFVHPPLNSDQKELEELFSNTLSEFDRKNASLRYSLHLTDSHKRNINNGDGDDDDDDRCNTPTLIDDNSYLRAAFPSIPAPPPLPSTRPMVPTPITSPSKDACVESDTTLIPSIQVEISDNDSKADFLFTNNFDLNGMSIKRPELYVSSRLSMPLPPPPICNPQTIPNSMSIPDFDTTVMRPKAVTLVTDKFNNRSIHIINEVDINVSSEEERDSPEPLKRADSSLSLVTDMMRPPSPGIIAIPLAVQLQEKIHVFYTNNRVSEQKYIKLEGNLTFAFLVTTLNSLIDRLSCTLNAENQLSLKPVDSNIASISQVTTVNFDMDALKAKLYGMQAENNSNRVFLVLPILNYWVKIPTSFPPIILHCVWSTPSVDQTRVEIEYSYNQDAFPVSPLPDINDVIITLNYACGNVISCECEPKAMWNKFHCKTYWTINSISSSCNSKGKLSALFDHFPDEELKQNVEVAFSCNTVLSGLTITLNTPNYRIAKMKQNLTSGVYKSTFK